jgi:glycosyltransferase involved in cell wall biosynthesis
VVAARTCGAVGNNDIVSYEHHDLLVSIIVPNYNHARFLTQRLQTILDQTYRDFELIILDDASTDDSREVIEKFAQDPRVRTVYNEKNTGSPFIQWNRGVAQAKGDYVWIAESDDYADPELLQSLVAVLRSRENLAVVYSQSWHVVDDGSVIGTIAPFYSDLDHGRWMQDFVNDGKDECSRYLIRKNTIPNASAAVFRRQLYEEAGGADANMRLAGDWMLWAKLLLRGDVAFVAKPLNYYRCHSSTVRSSVLYSTSEIEEFYRVCTFIKQQAGVAPKTYKIVCDALADRWLTSFVRCGLQSSNKEVMAAAKQFDQAVLQSLLRRFVARAISRLGRLAFPGAASQRRGDSPVR